jgi:hypothetical protein
MSTFSNIYVKKKLELYDNINTQTSTLGDGSLYKKKDSDGLFWKADNSDEVNLKNNDEIVFGTHFQTDINKEHDEIFGYLPTVISRHNIEIKNLPQGTYCISYITVQSATSDYDGPTITTFVTDSDEKKTILLDNHVIEKKVNSANQTENYCVYDYYTGSGDIKLEMDFTKITKSWYGVYIYYSSMSIWRVS